MSNSNIVKLKSFFSILIEYDIGDLEEQLRKIDYPTNQGILKKLRMPVSNI